MQPLLFRHLLAPGHLAPGLQRDTGLLHIIIDAAVSHIGPGHVGIEELEGGATFIVDGKCLKAVGLGQCGEFYPAHFKVIAYLLDGLGGSVERAQGKPQQE